MFYTTTLSTNYTSTVTEFSRTYMIIIFIMNLASVIPANKQNKKIRIKDSTQQHHQQIIHHP